MIGSIEPLGAHTGHIMSVQDAVAGALLRLETTLSADKREALTPAEALPLLTPEQKHALATQYIRFTVNQPVFATIARDVRWGSEPFWLERESFSKLDRSFKEAGTTFDIWEKRFEAGEIGLGINSLTGGGIHYLVTVRPANALAGKPLRITELYPKQLKLLGADEPVRPFIDNSYVLDSLPGPLANQQLIRLLYERRDEGKLLNVLNTTDFPARAEPDQWVLTWSDDPKTTQTVQWRTDQSKMFMQLATVRQRDPQGFKSPAVQVLNAHANALKTPTTVNDPINQRYAVTFTNLSPGERYRYAWRFDQSMTWQEVGTFRTAPNKPEDFSFLYLGDAQNGLSTWGSLIHRAVHHQPSARFILMAGDLVDRGNDRDDWDTFFAAAGGVFARHALVPVIGNHEHQGGYPSLYLTLFRLMENGPKSIAPERAYSFHYGDALLVILDTNVPLSSQVKWLEETLSSSKARWKFVSYHHPAYPSSKRKVNPNFQAQWLPLFDRYEVDFALQGHDHAYLRTYPMMQGKVMRQTREAGVHLGTRYLISVSGTKFYPQKDSPYIEKGFIKVPTYQIFELQVTQKQLTYRAFDSQGQVQDELVIVK
jgi:hypothetical protein